MDIDIDVDKLEGPLQEQDTNEKEGEDNADEVLESALNSLVPNSKNQSAGGSGRSSDTNKTHNDVHCGDVSNVSVAEISSSDNDYGICEDSLCSSVPENNSVEMEKDQGFNSPTDEAATTSESVPLAREIGKSESLCREEDDKIIVSANSPTMDEFPASGNLSERATDDVGSQLGAVPGSPMAFHAFSGAVAAAVDHPDLHATSPRSTAQDTTYPSMEQVYEGRLHSFIGVNN